MTLVAALAGVFGFYVWPKPPNVPPGYMAGHMLTRTGTQSYSASVRVQGTAAASEYVKDNYIILNVRSPDNTVDVHTDKIIDKSRTFQIPIGTATVTIEVPLSQNTLAA